MPQEQVHIIEGHTTSVRHPARPHLTRIQGNILLKKITITCTDIITTNKKVLGGRCPWPAGVRKRFVRSDRGVPSRCNRDSGLRLRECMKLAIHGINMERFMRNHRLIDRDPVCGRRISRNKAHILIQWNKREYLLCCPKCQSEFEAHPQRYVSAASSGGRVRNGLHTGRNV